jgi:hypothetical protein
VAANSTRREDVGLKMRQNRHLCKASMVDDARDSCTVLQGVGRSMCHTAWEKHVSRTAAPVHATLPSCGTSQAVSNTATRQRWGAVGLRQSGSHHCCVWPGSKIPPPLVTKKAKPSTLITPAAAAALTCAYGRRSQAAS